MNPAGLNRIDVRDHNILLGTKLYRFFSVVSVCFKKHRTMRGELEIAVKLFEISLESLSKRCCLFLEKVQPNDLSRPRVPMAVEREMSLLALIERDLDDADRSFRFVVTQLKKTSAEVCNDAEADKILKLCKKFFQMPGRMVQFT